MCGLNVTIFLSEINSFKMNDCDDQRLIVALATKFLDTIKVERKIIVCNFQDEIPSLLAFDLFADIYRQMVTEAIRHGRKEIFQLISEICLGFALQQDNYVDSLDDIARFYGGFLTLEDVLKYENPFKFLWEILRRGYGIGDVDDRSISFIKVRSLRKKSYNEAK